MASTHTVSWRDAVSRIWAEVEGDVCDGQKLQGVSTLSEVMHCLGRKYSDIAQVYAKYPLFSRIHEIAGQGMLPENLFVWE